MMNKFRYSPDEIANAICDHIGECNPAISAQVEETIYYLKACAENPYNSDHFLTTYKTLENLVDKIGIVIPF